MRGTQQHRVTCPHSEYQETQDMVRVAEMNTSRSIPSGERGSDGAVGTVARSAPSSESPAAALREPSASRCRGLWCRWSRPTDIPVVATGWGVDNAVARQKLSRAFRISSVTRQDERAAERSVRHSPSAHAIRSVRPIWPSTSHSNRAPLSEEIEPSETSARTRRRHLECDSVPWFHSISVWFLVRSGRDNLIEEDFCGTSFANRKFPGLSP